MFRLAGPKPNSPCLTLNGIGALVASEPLSFQEMFFLAFLLQYISVAHF